MLERTLTLTCRSVAALFTAALCAQDMVGVDWTGGIYTLDSATGVATPIGLGLLGQNGLCRDANGVLWACAGPFPVYSLVRVDPVAATATPIFPSFDFRALAAGTGTTLYGLAHGLGANALYRIDTATGTFTLVGRTGTTHVQAMTTSNGVLYAWDLNRGLGTIDPTTGVFTDVSLALGGNVQWLAVRSDGQLIGGGNELFSIDPVTGIPTSYASTTPVRGAETSQFAARFGAGCTGGGGGPVSLSVTGTLRPGSFVTTTSVGHSPMAAMFSGLGFLALGASNTTYGGAPLPVLLDPVLGTSGCSLFVSIDATSFTTIASGPPPLLQFTFAIPPGFQHATFYVQHFALDSVPGGLSASNGVVIRVAD